jgi:phage baseplate assembly protein W
MGRSILGRGLAFPPRMDVRGSLEMSDDERSIQESIKVILGTTPGERVMRPDFGCAVNDLVFSPNNSRTMNMACHYIEQSLIRWEHRIMLKEVKATPDPDDESRINISIGYEVRSVNTYFNMVYPFYLERGEIDTQSQFG